MKTVYHAYYYNTRNENEKRAYAELKRDLQGMGLKCFCTWGGSSHYNAKLDDLTIELETKHLFDNQWNTAPIEGVSDKGLRVFDWAEDHPIDFSPSIKRGHWLQQTPEMKAIRSSTCACGYCGHQEPVGLNIWCPKCLGSEYLSEEHLHLRRMKAVADASDRPKLTEAERAEIMPAFKEAQVKGVTEADKARNETKRKELVAECDKAIENAKRKRDGFLWLFDHGVKTENIIYYDHRAAFCVGWRSTVLSDEMKAAFTKELEAFPFPWSFDTKK